MRSQPRTYNNCSTSKRTAGTYTQQLAYTVSSGNCDITECCQTNAAAITDISNHLVVVDNSINFLFTVSDLSSVTNLILDISQNVYDNSQSIIILNTTVNDLSGVVYDLSNVVLDLSGDFNILSTAFTDLSSNVGNLSGIVDTKANRAGDTFTGLVTMNQGVKLDTYTPGTISQTLYTPNGVDVYWGNERLSVWDTSGTSLVLDSSYDNIIIPGSTTKLGVDHITHKAFLETDLSNINFNVNGNDVIDVYDNSLNVYKPFTLSNDNATMYFYAPTSSITGFLKMSIIGNLELNSRGSKVLHTDGSNVYLNNIDIQDLSSSLFDLSNVVLDLSNNVSSLNISDLSINIYDISATLNDLSTVVLDLSGDFNTLSVAFTDLSGVVADLSTVVLDLSGDFNTLSTAFTDLSGVVTDLSNVVLDLSGDFNTLSTAFTDLSGVVADLSTVVLDLSGDFNTLSTAFTDLSGVVTDLSMVVLDLSGDFNTLSVAFTDLSSVVTDISATLNDLSGFDITDLSENLFNLSTAFTDLSGVVADLSLVVLDFSGGFNTLNTAFTDLSGVVADLSLVILDLSGDFNTLSISFTDLSGTIIDLSGTIIDLSGTIIDLSGTIIDLSNNKVSKSGDTMTGNLTIDKSNPTLKLNANNDNSGNVYMSDSGYLWLQSLGHNVMAMNNYALYIYNSIILSGNNDDVVIDKIGTSNKSLLLQAGCAANCDDDYSIIMRVRDKNATKYDSLVIDGSAELINVNRPIQLATHTPSTTTQKLYTSNGTDLYWNGSIIGSDISAVVYDLSGTVADLSSNKVSKSGDTMTGNLNVNGLTLGKSGNAIINTSGTDNLNISAYDSMILDLSNSQIQFLGENYGSDTSRIISNTPFTVSSVRNGGYFPTTTWTESTINNYAFSNINFKNSNPEVLVFSISGGTIQNYKESSFDNALLINNYTPSITTNRLYTPNSSDLYWNGSIIGSDISAVVYDLSGTVADLSSNKVSKSGDTMTGNLNVNGLTLGKSGNAIINTNGTDNLNISTYDTLKLDISNTEIQFLGENGSVRAISSNPFTVSSVRGGGYFPATTWNQSSINNYAYSDINFNTDASNLNIMSIKNNRIENYKEARFDNALLINEYTPGTKTNRLYTPNSSDLYWNNEKITVWDTSGISLMLDASYNGLIIPNIMDISNISIELYKDLTTNSSLLTNNTNGRVGYIRDDTAKYSYLQNGYLYLRGGEPSSYAWNMGVYNTGTGQTHDIELTSNSGARYLFDANGGFYPSGILGISSEGIEFTQSNVPASTTNKLYRVDSDVYWDGQKLSVWDTSGTSLVIDPSYDSIIIPGSTTKLGVDSGNNKAYLETDLDSIELNFPNNKVLKLDGTAIGSNPVMSLNNENASADETNFLIYDPADANRYVKLGMTNVGLGFIYMNQTNRFRLASSSGIDLDVDTSFNFYRDLYITKNDARLNFNTITNNKSGHIRLSESNGYMYLNVGGHNFMEVQPTTNYYVQFNSNLYLYDTASNAETYLIIKEQNGQGEIWATNSGYLNFKYRTNHFMGASDSALYLYGNCYVNGSAITSDRRIKTNIQEINDDSALQIVKKIEPKTYGYIDQLRGDDTVYGFIAQEIKEIFPPGVKIDKGVIPDILKKITINGDIITFETDTELFVGNQIQIKEVLTHNNGKEVTVENKIDSKTYTISKKLDFTSGYCYGHYVDDFHYVIKDRLIPILWSATQQVIKDKEALTTEVKTLKTENTTLKQKVADLETENADIKSRLRRIEESLNLVTT